MFAIASSPDPRSDLSRRRLVTGLVLSLLAHAVLLSLRFSVPDMGFGSVAQLVVRLVPHAREPDVTAVAQADPPSKALPEPPANPARAGGFQLLPLPPVPLPVPLVKPPVRAAAKHSSPKPKRQPERVLSERVITQEAKPESDFAVPQAQPEKTDGDALALREGTEAGAGSAAAKADAGATLGADEQIAPVATPPPELARQLAADEAAVAEAKERERLAVAEQARIAAERQRLNEEQARALDEQRRAREALAQQQAEAARRVDQQRADEAQRLAAEDAARIQAETARREAQEERRRADELAAQRLVEQRAADETRQRLADLAARQQAEENRRQEDLVQQRAAELAAQAQAERQRAAARVREREQAERLAQEQAARAADEARRMAEEQAAARLAQEQAARAADEARRMAEEQAAARLAQEQAARAAEDARRNAEAQSAARLAQAANGPGGTTGNAREAGAAGHGTLSGGALRTELGGRARELMRGLDVLGAAPPAARPPHEESGARRRLISAATERDVPLRMYIDSFRQKIERNGLLNGAQLAASRVRVDPVVSVALRSDGSVEEVMIVRSSGHAEVDNAVRRIVRLNERYAAFPSNVAAHYDVIEIRRIWTFAEGLKLLEEVR